jgi:hypothetical protein
MADRRAQRLQKGINHARAQVIILVRKKSNEPYFSKLKKYRFFTLSSNQTNLIF